MGFPVVEVPELRGRVGVFRDRVHAGEVLAGLLEPYRGSGALVLAVPAGGVPVAARAAALLGLELDVAVVSKITLPWNTEAGYGAVAFDGTVRLNEGLLPHLRLAEEEVAAGVEETRRKVARRVRAFRGDRPPLDLSGRAAILIDDGVASGWNVDDVILKDGTLPDYAACGGCATAPAFSGAGAALDDDACAAGGVTVTWEPAVSWGTGGGGSYAVYRGLAPDFVPSGANLVASGIAALSWNDAAAPTDVDLYYVVRAENDEACGTGPANGGLIDDNLVRAHVSETTDRPLPGAVTTLGASLVNHAHVRLGWTAAAGAASYRIYRSDSPLPATFAPIAETAELSWEDLNQGAGAGSSYYSVRALNACGVEGP